MSHAPSRRPLSLAAGCALAAAGIASGITAVVTWSLLSSRVAAPDVCAAEAREAAARVALHVRMLELELELAAQEAERAARSIESLCAEKRTQRPRTDLVADHPFVACD